MSIHAKNQSSKISCYSPFNNKTVFGMISPLMIHTYSLESLEKNLNNSPVLNSPASAYDTMRSHDSKESLDAGKSLLHGAFDHGEFILDLNVSAKIRTGLRSLYGTSTVLEPREKSKIS